eukprot:c7848_g1_i1 orf=351-515(+)
MFIQKLRAGAHLQQAENVLKSVCVYVCALLHVLISLLIWSFGVDDQGANAEGPP